MDQGEWGLLMAAVANVIAVVAFLRDLFLRRSLRRASISALRPLLEEIRSLCGQVYSEQIGIFFEHLLPQTTPLLQRLDEWLPGVRDKRLKRTLTKLKESLHQMQVKAPRYSDMLPDGSGGHILQDWQEGEKQRSRSAAAEADGAAKTGLQRLSKLQSKA